MAFFITPVSYHRWVGLSIEIFRKWIMNNEWVGLADG